MSGTWGTPPSPHTFCSCYVNYVIIHMCALYVVFVFVCEFIKWLFMHLVYSLLEEKETDCLWRNPFILIMKTCGKGVSETCIVYFLNTDCHFPFPWQKMYMNINRILSVASRLMETGHYAAQHIGNVAAKLDQVGQWTGFPWLLTLAVSCPHELS